MEQCVTDINPDAFQGVKADMFSVADGMASSSMQPPDAQPQPVPQKKASKNQLQALGGSPADDEPTQFSTQEKEFLQVRTDFDAAKRVAELLETKLGKELKQVDMIERRIKGKKG